MDYDYICELIKGKFISRIATEKFMGKFKVNSKEITDGDAFIAINTGYKYIEEAIKKKQSIRIHIKLYMNAQSVTKSIKTLWRRMIIWI